MNGVVTKQVFDTDYFERGNAVYIELLNNDYVTDKITGLITSSSVTEINVMYIKGSEEGVNVSLRIEDIIEGKATMRNISKECIKIVRK